MGTLKTQKYSVRYTIENGIVVLDDIEVKKPYRRSGYGKQAMQRFMDKFSGRKIELHAFALDQDTSTDKLVCFYEKFGFEVVEGSELTGYEMRNY